MADTTDIKKGFKMLIDGQPYAVVDHQFVKPGKGQAPRLTGGEKSCRQVCRVAYAEEIKRGLGRHCRCAKDRC